ncbi:MULTISPECIES: hypothetical protein [unclassified Bacillus cereus group]|uniref:hypothetical protein n=1 Tax=unclassified Bacillus cereus group TaxID=2750818 RepID=UPI001F5876A3|nr:MULTISPECIES: hypothetical protein [unclassified Bacillus cereus group]MCU5281591.1 hypothetical protein [Bacillus cereus]
MATVKNTIAIKTEKGEISAIAVNDDAYPSIKIMINGELVTVVELDSDNDNFRIHNYQGTEDEPIASYDYNPKSIFDYEIVQEEIERIRSLEDDGRDIEVDISIFKQGLSEINQILYGQKEQVIISNPDMWEECHISLDKILEFFNLEVADETYLIVLGHRQFLVVKK